jgi:hypothetical protein
MPWDTAVAAFAVTAAALLVGGGIVLRYQRDRYHFLLTQAALEKGITSFGDAVPPWLVSLRIGALALVLGIGLIGAGVAFYRTARWIEEPAIGRQPSPRDATPSPAAAPAADRAPAANDPDAPPAPPPQGRPRADDNRRPLPPPPPSPPQPETPAMQRWHRVQTQRTIGLVCVCTGVILSLLGVVRIAFARVERRYVAPPAPAAPPA